MKKKFLFILTILCVAFSAFSLTACNGGESEDWGNGSAGLYYNLSDDGTYYRCTAFGWDKLVKTQEELKTLNIVVASEYKGLPVKETSATFQGGNAITSVTIPDSIETIGYNTFYDCASLKNVTIGNGVKEIANQAFYGCSSLESISLPNGVVTIGGNAFSNCTSLTSVTLSDNITSFGFGGYGSSVFEGCTGLEFTEVDNALYFGTASNPYMILIQAKDKNVTACTVKENCKFINNNAFSQCSKLESVILPDSLLGINRNAFSSCEKLKNINIPNNVTYIDEGAFQRCKTLESVKIPNKVKIISRNAFYYCTALTEVIIGNSVEDLGSYAFSGCKKLKKINIPNSLKNLSYGVFGGCDALLFNEYNNALYLGNDENKYLILIKAKNLDIESFAISDKCRFIYDGAFKDCKKLTSINLGSKVEYIGDNAFDGCSEVKSVDVLSTINYRWAVFANCSKLETINISEGVTSINREMFSNCTALKSVTLPNSLTLIDWYAFRGCTALTSMVFPSSIEHIYCGAFMNCTALESISISGYIDISEYYGVDSEDSFYGCTSLVRVNYNGTKEDFEWNNFANYFLYDLNNGKTITVYCTDGNLQSGN